MRIILMDIGLVIFTCRSAFKGYERYSNNILQVTKQLNALANLQAGNMIFYLSKEVFFSVDMKIEIDGFR